MVCVRGGEGEPDGAEVGGADELGTGAVDEVGGLAVTGDPPDVHATTTMPTRRMSAAPTTTARGL
jgi:hypothetical protein